MQSEAFASFIHFLFSLACVAPSPELCAPFIVCLMTRTKYNLEPRKMAHQLGGHTASAEELRYQGTHMCL